MSEIDENEDPEIIGVFDLDLMRPGCAILQALGGDPRISRMFPSDSWLDHSTPGMKRIKAPLSKWREVCIEIHGRAYA